MEDVPFSESTNSTNISETIFHIPKLAYLLLTIPVYVLLTKVKCSRCKDRCLRSKKNKRNLTCKLFDNQSNNECCICLQEFISNEEIVELPCNHIYHKQCIEEWLKVNRNCPSCRIDV